MCGPQQRAPPRCIWDWRSGDAKDTTFLVSSAWTRPCCAATYLPGATFCDWGALQDRSTSAPYTDPSSACLRDALATGWTDASAVFTGVVSPTRHTCFREKSIVGLRPQRRVAGCCTTGTGTTPSKTQLSADSDLPIVRLVATGACCQSGLCEAAGDRCRRQPADDCRQRVDAGDDSAGCNGSADVHRPSVSVRHEHDDALALLDRRGDVQLEDRCDDDANGCDEKVDDAICIVRSCLLRIVAPCRSSAIFFYCHARKRTTRCTTAGPRLWAGWCRDGQSNCAVTRVCPQLQVLFDEWYGERLRSLRGLAVVQRKHCYRPAAVVDRAADRRCCAGRHGPCGFRLSLHRRKTSGAILTERQ
jgi:hypothetical protein